MGERWCAGEVATHHTIEHGSYIEKDTVDKDA